jgi:hypothetical protein
MALGLKLVSMSEPVSAFFDLFHTIEELEKHVEKLVNSVDFRAFKFYLNDHPHPFNILKILVQGTYNDGDYVDAATKYVVKRDEILHYLMVAVESLRCRSIYLEVDLSSQTVEKINFTRVINCDESVRGWEALVNLEWFLDKNEKLECSESVVNQHTFDLAVCNLEESNVDNTDHEKEDRIVVSGGCRSPFLSLLDLSFESLSEHMCRICLFIKALSIKYDISAVSIQSYLASFGLVCPVEIPHMICPRHVMIDRSNVTMSNYLNQFDYFKKEHSFGFVHDGHEVVFKPKASPYNQAYITCAPIIGGFQDDVGNNCNILYPESCLAWYIPTIDESQFKFACGIEIVSQFTNVRYIKNNDHLSQVIGAKETTYVGETAYDRPLLPDCVVQHIYVCQVLGIPLKFRPLIALDLPESVQFSVDCVKCSKLINGEWSTSVAVGIDDAIVLLKSFILSSNSLKFMLMLAENRTYQNLKDLLKDVYSPFDVDVMLRILLVRGWVTYNGRFFITRGYSNLSVAIFAPYKQHLSLAYSNKVDRCLCAKNREIRLSYKLNYRCRFISFNICPLFLSNRLGLLRTVPPQTPQDEKAVFSFKRLIGEVRNHDDGGFESYRKVVKFINMADRYCQYKRWEHDFRQGVCPIRPFEYVCPRRCSSLYNDRLNEATEVFVDDCK